MIGTAGYYSAYVYVIWRTVTGSLSYRHAHFSDRRYCASERQHPTDFLDDVQHCGPGAVPHRLAGVFRNAADDPFASRMRCQLLAQSCADSNFAMFRFRYPGTSRLVLNNLDFHLRAGERVALIGENGGGKTTLVKLMTRLYDPVEGQILLDGVDLREYDLEDLYREIGVIFQDFMRYEMTARENIAVGRIDEMDNLPLLKDSSGQEHGRRRDRKTSARLRANVGATF